jgi:endogenous inhibitor of DNA gyrase (YacG/DUF329 family)
MSDVTHKSRGTCPICGGPSDIDYRPFCSRRCADVDLSRWLRGAYVIPGPAEGGDKGDAAPSDRGGDMGGDTGGETTEATGGETGGGAGKGR